MFGLAADEDSSGGFGWLAQATPLPGSGQDQANKLKGR